MSEDEWEPLHYVTQEFPKKVWRDMTMPHNGRIQKQEIVRTEIWLCREHKHKVTGEMKYVKLKFMGLK